MANKTDEELQKIHCAAIRAFDQIQTACQDEREQCLEERRFYSVSGAQWEGKWGAQFENKPKLEINKIHLSIIRIYNEYLNNRITVDFISKEGRENDKLADTCDGLYRADEQNCDANEAYDNAFLEAIGGGIGAWRLKEDYEDHEDDENEYQKILIEPIYDADSCVFFDLNAKRQDKRDATSCFVLTAMTAEAYEEKYGEIPSDIGKLIDSSEFDWYTNEAIYVAEYYTVEYHSDTILVYKTIDGEEERYSKKELEENPDKKIEVISSGATLVREKKVKKKRIHKYIIDGSKVLEDCGLIAGPNIPIVVVYGKRWIVDGVERAMGHVRLCKDIQRLLNMQLSKLAELSALSSTEKPIVTPEQIAGHELTWADDSIKNYPYLMLNPITDANGNMVPAGPIGTTKPPQIPQALAALLQITNDYMKDLLGNQEAGEELMNNLSGKAVELIQNRLDMQTYVYMANMAKAIKRSGEIWLGKAKSLYVEDGRKMKTLGKTYEVGSIELNKPMLSDEGKIEYENDLSEANFDLAVDVGPSSSSRRSATVRALSNMMQVTQDPATVQVLSSMIMMNMEGEGISEVRDYFRKNLLRMGAIQPTEEEAQELMMEAQNQQPDANTTYLQSAAMNEQAKAQNEAADTAKKIAETEETKVKTMEIAAKIDREDQQQAIDNIVKLTEATAQPQSMGENIIGS